MKNAGHLYNSDLFLQTLFMCCSHVTVLGSYQEEYLDIRYSLSSVSCVITESHPKIHLLPDLRPCHTSTSELWTYKGSCDPVCSRSGCCSSSAQSSQLSPYPNPLMCIIPSRNSSPAGPGAGQTPPEVSPSMRTPREGAGVRLHPWLAGNQLPAAPSPFIHSSGTHSLAGFPEQQS